MTEEEIERWRARGWKIEQIGQGVWKYTGPRYTMRAHGRTREKFRLLRWLRRRLRRHLEE